MLVEVDQAVFGYRGRAVVRADHLTLEAGRCLGVFGPNGAGKTTLIRGVTGLLPPIAGAVMHGDRRAEGAPGQPWRILGKRRQKSPIRFAYIPQQRSMDLNWPMTGLDAAAMAASARRLFGWLGKSTASVLAMMRRLGVEDLANRAFARLSGGQQQRTLLAGAMASGPDVLVLDEPTDGLDVDSTRTLLDLLRDFTVKGLCTVIISHEVEDLLFLCDEVAWLHGAQTVAQPSNVEIISPAALAERMTHARRGV